MPLAFGRSDMTAAMFHFWIEGHDMRIIEADGVDTQELAVDALTISVAQRYSILVTARNDTTQNWGIHANMVSAPPRGFQLDKR